LRDKTALHVAVVPVDKAFCVYGFPRAIISDRGTEFCNAILDDVTRLLGIQKLRTTAYRPSANSRAERSHKTLHALFAKTIAADAKDWEDKLPAVTAAYSAAYHETTGLSPFFLMHRRTFRTPVDLMMDVPEEAKAKTYTEYGDQLEETLRNAFCLVNQSFEHEYSTNETEVRREGPGKEICHRRFCMVLLPPPQAWTFSQMVTFL
jgi:hypothetical protein